MEWEKTQLKTLKPIWDFGHLRIEKTLVHATSLCLTKEASE